MRFLPLIIVLLAAPLAAGEQVYVVKITDYAVVESVKALFAGDSLVKGFEGGKLGLSSDDVVTMLKSHDLEFSFRARMNWRADGDRLKHARGFYEARIFLWETFGPLRHLDYQVAFVEEGGARTTVHSRLDLDVRQFSYRGGDRLVFMLANIRPVHRLINRVAETAVQAAERALIEGYALADIERRDWAREERRRK